MQNFGNAMGVISGVRNDSAGGIFGNLYSLATDLNRSPAGTGTDYSLGDAHLGDGGVGPRLGDGTDGAAFATGGTATGTLDPGASDADPDPYAGTPPGGMHIVSPDGQVLSIGDQRRTSPRGGLIFGNVADNFVDARGYWSAYAETGLISENYDLTSTVANTPITANSFNQANIGNCFLAADLKAVALSNPGFLDSNMAFGPDGSVAVRLYDRNGSPVTVMLDAMAPDLAGAAGQLLPTGTNDAGIFKALLYQKAMVAAWPQLNRSEDPKYAADFRSISKGGWPHDVLRFITGQAPTTNPTGAGRVSDDQLYNRIVQDSIDGRPTVAWTRDLRGDLDWFLPNNALFNRDENAGLVGIHAYTVVGAYTDESGNRMVRVWNPWGWGERGAMSGPDASAADGINDGIMSMSIADFNRDFAWITSVPVVQQTQNPLRWENARSGNTGPRRRP